MPSVQELFREVFNRNTLNKCVLPWPWQVVAGHNANCQHYHQTPSTLNCEVNPCMLYMHDVANCNWNLLATPPCGQAPISTLMCCVTWSPSYTWAGEQFLSLRMYGCMACVLHGN